MNRRSVIFSAAALTLAAGAGVIFSPGALSPAGMAFAQEEAPVDTSRVVEMSLGNPDAAVTVIEYASFTCPHCRAFHDGPFKQLKADYIDTGKIHFIYREVYFDRFGLWGAMLARCGGEQRYFGISDMLYDNQQEWLGNGDPATIAENLKKIGLTAGLTAEQVDACMQDAEMAKALVAVYQKNAEADSIDSTPSFIINGEKYSNMSYEDFSAILEEKLGS
jgi:protein-disulfide isomerase